MDVRIIKWLTTVFVNHKKNQKYLITNLIIKIIFTEQYGFH